MIQKLMKSLRKFVCSKLKTYKRNRYRSIQLPPPIHHVKPAKDFGCTLNVPDTPRTTNPRSRPKKTAKEQKICIKAGEYTKNPFFNYLREFRKTHSGMTIVEQAIEAGAEWRCMTKDEKCKYVVHTDGKLQRRRRYKRRSIYWIKRSKIEV